MRRSLRTFLSNRGVPLFTCFTNELGAVTRENRIPKVLLLEFLKSCRV